SYFHVSRKCFFWLDRDVGCLRSGALATGVGKANAYRLAGFRKTRHDPKLVIISVFASPIMHRLRIAYAMINCNRRDGGARALNELAERMAVKHEVHLFARRAEEIDLSHIEWHRMPGLSWPAVLDFFTYHALAEFTICRRSFDIIHSVGPNAMA